MRSFLAHVVETQLNGDGDGLKEQSIAADVFGKDSDFDTRLNPIVRVEARRLRSRLLEYYNEEGSDDAVLIQLPRGAYVPKFVYRASEEALPSDPIDVAASVAPPPAYQAVAVLPFVDISANGDNRSFCDGLTEEIINALTRVKDLEVVARSSAFQFRGAGRDVREVGAKLGVGSVMEGSVRKSGDRLRATIQLANANNGFHLWSETFDVDAGDSFSIQEDIARQVVKTLRAQRGERLAHELTKKQSTKSQAFQHYIQGVYHSRQIRDRNVSSGLQHFKKAISIDESYAQAHAGLAKCHCSLAWLGLESPSTALVEAKTAAAKALELDEEGAGSAAHAALGAAICIGDWNFEAGKSELLHAIEADSGEYVAYQWYALGYLAPMGFLDKALAVMLNGSERAGNSLLAQNHVGMIHFYAGEYSEAQRWHEAILRENPGFGQALWDLGRTYMARERYDEAHKTLSEAVEISGGKPMFLGSLGYCEAAMGNRASAKRLAANLVNLSETIYVSPLAIAQIHLGLENTDEVFRWLNLAIEERSCRLIELDNDPIYDTIRDDERMKKVREAVCLTQPNVED